MSSMVQNGRTRLGRKLLAASRMGSNVKKLGSQDAEIIFDTGKTIEDTEKMRQSQSLKDFDKLLDGDSNDVSSFQ